MAPLGTNTGKNKEPSDIPRYNQRTRSFCPIYTHTHTHTHTHIYIYIYILLISITSDFNILIEMLAKDSANSNWPRGSSAKWILPVSFWRSLRNWRCWRRRWNLVSRQYLSYSNIEEIQRSTPYLHHTHSLIYIYIYIYICVCVCVCVLCVCVVCLCIMHKWAANKFFIR